MEQSEAFAYTAKLSGELFRGEEAAEGMKAFLQKRPAAWTMVENADAKDSK
jgi:enoyl-CoA hydratase/carnithine racemase